MLQVKAKRLSVIGSDGETTIAAQCAASDCAEGMVLLPPRPIAAFLATLHANTVVTVTAEDAGDVAVTADGITPYRFRPISATFPLPTTPREKAAKVDFSRLAAAVAAVRPAVDKATGGLQIQSSSAGLWLRSTDNYRLHGAFLPEAGFGDFSGVIPLTVLERAARHQVDTVTADPKGRSLRFAGPEMIVSARLLQVPFPDAGALLEDVAPVTVSVPTGPMLASLARLAAVAEASPVTLTIDGDELTIDVSNPELGSGSETIGIDPPSPARLTFAADRGYLADAIACHPEGHVIFGWRSPVQPVTVRSTTPFLITTIVMPVRV